jgi:hypothetical protein
MSNYLINAEYRCYNYLLDKLGGLDGVNGYMGKFPRRSGEVDGLREWAFAITGEDENLAELQNVGEGARQSNGLSCTLTGRFTDRVEALRFAGELMELGTVSFNNVQYFGHNSGEVPEIVPEVFNVGDTGYELDGWLVEYKMLAVVDRVDEPDAM